MDSPNNLEIKGSLRTDSLAELLCEIADYKFNGSLRLARETHKVIVYFEAGAIVFAVSNARQHRLFEMLLQDERFSKDQITAISDFTGDLALRENLLKENLVNEAEIDRIFSELITEVLKTSLAWRDGEWAFSPFVRVKSSIRFEVNLSALLIAAAREQSAAEAARKFRNPLEPINIKPAMPADVVPSPQESFVFSRFEGAILTVEEIQSLSGLPEAETFQILYALWLGGFITRQDQHRAFSEKDVFAIQSAKLTVKKEAIKPAIQPPIKTEAAENLGTGESSDQAENAAETSPETPNKNELSLDDYLERVEKATNLYDIFALSSESAAADIKQTYFALAKRFHPDLFHKEADAKLAQRVQDAFSELARAYETLKHETSRDVYNFRMRKELAELNEQREAGATIEEIDVQKQNDQAALNFKQGFDFLMDENHKAAVQFLARAVHFDGGNARYHAYYGKALSADNKNRHKAEAEFQTAVKLDGENADYRIMLAEFFLQVGLVKRAEGELKRLLAIFPSNREAQAMLDRLPKK